VRIFKIKIFAGLFVCVCAGFAAEPPHIGYIYPAGGKQGTVVEITVGGKNIKDAIAVHVTGTRVTGKVLEDPDKDLI